MSERVVILGCGTCQLEVNRAASSVLVELKKGSFLFDIGRMITLRLAQLKITQNKIRNIVISHFHPDHVSDLIPFLHAASWSKIDPRTVPLRIFVPKGGRDFIESLLIPYGKENIISSQYSVTIEEVGELVGKPKFLIDELEVSFLHLPPAGNHGIVFETSQKKIAITGDAFFGEKLRSFIRLAETVIIDSGHLSDEEIIQLAVEKGDGTIVCSHLYRDLDINSLENLAKKEGFTGKLIVASDFMQIT